MHEAPLRGAEEKAEGRSCMPWGFRRRIKLADGLFLNIGKKGWSITTRFGWFKYTIGPSTKRLTASIPGTGIYYTTSLGARAGSKAARRMPMRRIGAEGISVPESALYSLNPGFFARLFMNGWKQKFVDGLRELLFGGTETARRLLGEAARHHPDPAFVSAYLAARRAEAEEAVEYIRLALARREKMGEWFEALSLEAEIVMYITPEFHARIPATVTGLDLLAVEILQVVGLYAEAWEIAAGALEEQSGRRGGMDPLIVLSYIELGFEVVAPEDREKFAEYVVQVLTSGTGNESPLQVTLLLYRSKALRTLGRTEEALETVAYALKRRKGVDDELKAALYEERALCCEAMGLGRKASAARRKARLLLSRSTGRDVGPGGGKEPAHRTETDGG